MAVLLENIHVWDRQARLAMRLHPSVPYPQAQLSFYLISNRQRSRRYAYNCLHLVCRSGQERVIKVIKSFRSFSQLINLDPLREYGPTPDLSVSQQRSLQKLSRSFSSAFGADFIHSPSRYLRVISYSWIMVSQISPQKL